MTEEEAAVHPQRHILTRALGVSSQVDTDMWELELRTGDRLLLCSDGLTNEVGIDELAAILGEVDDPELAAQQLVDTANRHGGADNITVVVVDVQVGEEGDGTSSKVTPLVLGAPAAVVAPATAAVAVVQSPSTVQPASGPGAEAEVEPGPGDASGLSDATAVVPAVRPDDTLAPGAQLVFGDEPATLAETGPRSDEFFMGAATAAVPVARSTTRVPPPPGKRDTDKPEGKESRGARRRRLGIPRRITPRVIGFVILVAAVPVAAYYVLKWYAYDNWVVTAQGEQIVVKQGQLGGVLWFHPKVVDRTGFTTSDVSPTAVGALKAGVQQSSLASARRYVTSITTTTTTTTSTTTTTTTIPVHRIVTPSPPSTTTTTAPLPTTTAPVTAAP
jgi:hypothetical protein